MGQILDIVINILQQIKQAEDSLKNGEPVSLPVFPVFDEKKVLSEQLATLTPMERKIMNQLADDMTVIEIANFFKLSKRTIETHRDNIRKKLKLESVKDLQRRVVPLLKRMGKVP